jgi:hypothetical protein
VNARIGAARDRQADPLTEQLLEGVGKDALDGPQPRLGCPAGEAGTVILEREL